MTGAGGISGCIMGPVAEWDDHIAASLSLISPFETEAMGNGR